MDQANFSLRAELKELHHQDPDEIQSPGIETLLSKWTLRLLTLHDVGYRHSTCLLFLSNRRSYTSPRAAGSQFMLSAGYNFHLNCAYSAVGMHWYLADFWKNAKARLKTAKSSFWDRGLMGEWEGKGWGNFPSSFLVFFALGVENFQWCLQAIFQSLSLINADQTHPLGRMNVLFLTSFLICAFLWS